MYECSPKQFLRKLIQSARKTRGYHHAVPVYIPDWNKEMFSLKNYRSDLAGMMKLIQLSVQTNMVLYS